MSGDTAKSRDTSESGYTLQTLIIIAILVLAATTATALLYAVLRDSTSRIAGGSETFDGLPSGPQNLQVESEPSGSGVDVTISWEAPSYLGEFPLTGYEVFIRNTDTDARVLSLDRSSCGNRALNTLGEDFTYGNSCSDIIPSADIDDDDDYELVFTIQLGLASDGSSPGGLTFYRDLDLSTMRPPPSQVQTVRQTDAIAVSWEAEPNIAYRLYVDLNGNDVADPSADYYQCFTADGNSVTREIPNIRNRLGYQSDNSPVKGTEFTVKLSASNSAPTNLITETYCNTDTNFGRETSFTANFGTPATPEFTLETDLTRTAGTETLPSLKATLVSCDDESSTTFYWEIADQPDTRQSYTIEGCVTSSCVSNCVITIYEDFTLNTEYEVWAIVEDAVGTSSPSARQRWMPTRATTTSAPSSPQNISTVSGDNEIIISWTAPDFIPEDGISGYILRHADQSSGSCPATLSTEVVILASAQQHKFPRASQNNFGLTCFQLSAFSIDSNLNENESSRVNFEAVYIVPITITSGLNEFLLNWYPTPRAAYYTISWAPLKKDTTCLVGNAVGFDLEALNLQPERYLSETIPYNGETTLAYTIPVTGNRFYIVTSTATLRDGTTTSWERYLCSTKHLNAPIMNTPQWTGTTTAGTPIGIQWRKPNLNASNYDNRYAPYSYVLRVTQPGTTPITVDRCIPFGHSSLTDVGNDTSFSIADMSVAGDYSISITVAPSGDCGDATDAASIIDSLPAATPTIQTLPPRTVTT